MIRRCEPERWMQFLRSFWEGWNIAQRLVCHPVLCIPNFHQEVYTSHLSGKDRTGLMNSYHIPMRDCIASMASTARMQDRSLWVACWTTDAWQWCGIAALTGINSSWSLFQHNILSRSFSDLHWLLGWHWTLAPKEWTCFMERTQSSLECSQQAMWWVCSQWAKDSRFPFNLPVRRG